MLNWEEFSRGGLVVWADQAAFVYEGTDGVDEAGRFEKFDLAGFGLLETPASLEAVPAGDRPDQDAGQFGFQPAAQVQVFLSLPAFCELEHNEPAEDGVGIIGQAGKLVSQQHEPA